MTEFTKEWIKEVRQTSYLSRPILTNSRLDEIESLLQRIAELEQELNERDEYIAKTGMAILSKLFKSSQEEE